MTCKRATTHFQLWRRLREVFAPPPLMPGMIVLIWVSLIAILIDAARILTVAALLIALAMMVIA